MKNSLQKIMNGLIDYAGLFPPAKLPLDEAIAEYISHLKEDKKWMLGRFIIPISQLNDLEEFIPQFKDVETLRLSVLGGQSNSDKEFLQQTKDEIDRFCDSMSSIKNEIDKIIAGDFSKQDNPLRGSPHTSLELTSDNWNHKYSREEAAYPKSWLRENKFWPSVGRVDNTYGDRNLICSCLDVKAYSEESK